jgi:S1-C subfamily serine protease
MEDQSKLIVVLLVVVGLFIAGGASAVSVMSQMDSQGNESIVSDNESDINTNTDVTETNSDIQKAVNGTVTLYIERDGQLTSQGSGFIYKDEYILSNQHVVSSNQQEVYDSETIFIKYADDSWTEAEIVGTDKYTDIAVLDPETIPDFATTLELQQSVPEQGSRVYAVGAPLGFSDSITSGVVSATGRSMQTRNNFTIPDTIQTDTEIDSGNSGGPLVLAEDPTTVVGVNRAKQGSAIGFAISGRLADRVATSIIQTGEFNHNYIGISARGLNPIIPGYEDVSIKKGIVIADTMEGTPAYEKLEPATSEGGIEDIIVEVEGQDVSDLEDLSQYLTLNKDVGDEVEMTVYNGGETRKVTITLADRSDFISDSN